MAGRAWARAQHGFLVPRWPSGLHRCRHPGNAHTRCRTHTRTSDGTSRSGMGRGGRSLIRWEDRFGVVPPQRLQPLQHEWHGHPSGANPTETNAHSRRTRRRSTAYKQQTVDLSFTSSIPSFPCTLMARRLHPFRVHCRADRRREGAVRLRRVVLSAGSTCRRRCGWFAVL